MSSPARRTPLHSPAHKWETIRYALDSNVRTVRLCVIMLVASVPPGLLALFIRR